MMMTMMMIKEGYGCLLFVSSNLKGQNKARLSRFFLLLNAYLYLVDEQMFKLSNLCRKTKRTLYRVKLENSRNK